MAQKLNNKNVNLIEAGDCLVDYRGQKRNVLSVSHGKRGGMKIVVESLIKETPATYNKSGALKMFMEVFFED